MIIQAIDSAISVHFKLDNSSNLVVFLYAQTRLLCLRIIVRNRTKIEKLAQKKGKFLIPNNLMNLISIQSVAALD